MQDNKPALPTHQQVEKLRLLLSTYQDGTGRLASTQDLPLPKGMTLPGWRDFERAVAAVFGGEAQESKYVFDVIVPDPANPAGTWGISCKMRRELNRVAQGDGRVTMELSNSSKQFWQHLHKQGIDEVSYREKPAKVGAGLIEVVTSWHEAASRITGGMIDLSKSYYLVLSWNKKRAYQLHQFALDLPQNLRWFSQPRKPNKENSRQIAFVALMRRALFLSGMGHLVGNSNIIRWLRALFGPRRFSVGAAAFLRRESIWHYSESKDVLSRAMGQHSVKGYFL